MSATTPITTAVVKPVVKSMKDDKTSENSYKLTYFDAQWLAEPIRYLLCYEGEEFEDVRLSWEEWEKGNPKIDKTAYRYSKLPMLEVKETKGNQSSSCLSLSQSFPILRYLGRKYNLVGSTIAEEAKCEEISDCVKDILKEVEDMMMTVNEKRKKELLPKILSLTIPRYFNVFEKDLKDKMAKTPIDGSGVGVITKLPLVGDNLTWLDFQFAHFAELFEQVLTSEGSKSEGGDLKENLFDSFPMLKAHQKWVFSLDGVKEWRESRPITEY